MPAGKTKRNASSCPTNLIHKRKNAGFTGIIKRDFVEFTTTMLVRKRDSEEGLSRASMYARHASTAFNRRMHKILQDLCRELAGELSGKLHAILLGGNYGRGEGGTRPVPGGHGSGVWSIGEAPAEDIDLLIVSWFDLRGRNEAISGILAKYEAIFTVPIDLAPVVTPFRLIAIPRRFHWRRLIASSKMLYGPPRLPQALKRRYGQSFTGERYLAWSLLFDQGLRLIDVLAREQGAVSGAGGNVLTHQGKFFREIAAAVILAHGRYVESVELQMHEFIVLLDDLEGDYEHLRILKALLPKAVAVLREPEQPGLDMPENWLYHLNLWLETERLLSGTLKPCPGILLGWRLGRCRAVIRATCDNHGVIPDELFREVRRISRLLNWVRHHVFFI
jgi:hypothetical protein